MKLPATTCSRKYCCWLAIGADSIQARYVDTVRGRARLVVAAGAGRHLEQPARWHPRLACCTIVFCFSTAIPSSTSTSSIWSRAPATPAFTWRFAPTSSAIDTAAVVLDGDRVRAFVAPGQGATGPVNAGVYVADRSITDRDRPPPRLAGAGRVPLGRGQWRPDRNRLSRLLHRHRYSRGPCARRCRTRRAVAASGRILRPRRRPQS